MAHEHESEASLYARDGARKYLNLDERGRVIAAVEVMRRDQALFALTLAWTGARVSEVLALTPASFQIERGIVALRTLKRRKHSVREVPIPPELMSALDSAFGLLSAQRNPPATEGHLWPWHRVTAWRIIKGVMARAGIEDAAPARAGCDMLLASARCKRACRSISHSAGSAMRGSAPPRSMPMPAARRSAPSPRASGR